MRDHNSREAQGVLKNKHLFFSSSSSGESGGEDGGEDPN